MKSKLPNSSSLCNRAKFQWSPSKTKSQTTCLGSTDYSGVFTTIKNFLSILGAGT